MGQVIGRHGWTGKTACRAFKAVCPKAIRSSACWTCTAGRGVKGCLVGSRPGSSWLDNRSRWLALGSQLPKGHLSPLPLALCVRVSDAIFSDYFVAGGLINESTTIHQTA